MNSLSHAAFAAAALSAGTAGGGATDKECRTVRILSDGSRIEGRADKGVASAAASASGNRSASVSTSVSASSSSDGRSSSRVSSSTFVDGKGRRITTTRDDDGCTVTIDERSDQGE